MIDKENTTIVSGAGKKGDIQARITQIKAQIEETTDAMHATPAVEEGILPGGGVALLRAGKDPGEGWTTDRGSTKKGPDSRNGIRSPLKQCQRDTYTSRQYCLLRCREEQLITHALRDAQTGCRDRTPCRLRCARSAVLSASARESRAPLLWALSTKYLLRRLCSPRLKSSLWGSRLKSRACQCRRRCGVGSRRRL